MAAGLPLLLAACSDRPAGEWPSDEYAAYEMQRAEAEAAAAAPAQQPTVSPSEVFAAPTPTQTLPPAGGGISSNELAAAGIGGTGAPATTGSPPTATPGLTPAAPMQTVSPEASYLNNDVVRAGVEASPSNAAPSVINNPGISDEQDFNAVASRETIESDAERLAENAAQYQVVQPTALPERTTETGPNIVEYALGAPNRKGQEWYSRSIIQIPNQFERNCASYNSPDEAQRDFLARGGPNRDPKGIDPDGDGFACGWDPAPFLAAVGRG
ncbi:hypothetical protein GZA08_15960 [Pseudoroseicyclus sp. CLL3-39]|uniref:Excalibur calcium-binding domain-containing protein n=2 Tax=Pseudoroseicyclus tamaricis TaxID=2705421 RepID=A0A6B2K6F9_9RHOB|nr:hypothetical protein [Pseudoroseicyclus tamaricis]